MSQVVVHGNTAYVAETLFTDYRQQNGVNSKIVRIFNTYGPRMHPFDGRVVSNFIRQALAGEDITIFGDGSQTRSFCYRDDLIEGFIRMMNGSSQSKTRQNSNSSRNTLLHWKVAHPIQDRVRLHGQLIPIRLQAALSRPQGRPERQ